MRVCSQQYTFVFSFIVFRIHVIVGSFFENKLVKSRCASISHTVDNYVIATVYDKFFITKHVIPSLSRRMPYTVSIILFFPLSLRKSPMYSCSSGPKCCDNAFRSSDVCIWCWTDDVNESFVVSKTFSSFIGFAASIVAVWTFPLVNPSRRLIYVASIYVIRLTCDLPRCLLFSFSSYLVSCLSYQTFWYHRAAWLLSRAY